MMHAFRRFSFAVAAAVFLTAAGDVRAQSASPSSATVQRLYTDATAKETAVRKALTVASPAPTVLKAVRTVVLQYETVVRRFPASAYCDNALWNAAQLSFAAFREFSDPREQTTAIRLLQSLMKEYPSSKLAKQSPPIVAQIEAMTAKGSVVLPQAPKPATPEPPQVSVPHTAPVANRKTSTPTIATIRDVRRASLPDVVRVVVELDREVSFHDERIENPTRVFLDLPATDATDALRDQTIRFEGDGDVVRQVRLGRHPNDTTRIVIDAAGISSYSVYPLYNPFRLVIDCLRTYPTTTVAALPPFPKAPLPLPPLSASRVTPSARALPAVVPTGDAAISEALLVDPPPAPVPTPVTPAAVDVLPASPVLGVPSRNLAGGFSLARQLGLGVSRIVIDPGHGGHDPGAKGKGTTEAELVLDVALRLEKLLQKSPVVEVVLTRRTDDFVPLQERTAIANREGADLFLSIHANASNTASARGVETYFLNFATNLSASAVAARENAASGQTMGELPDVVKTIALNNKLDESKDFATYVQREMVSKLKPANKTIRDLGVKQAPFVVLIGAAMPSVLAEISFVTNTQEARLLKQGSYRQRIAEALFDAIRKYQGSLKRVSTVAQQP